jgi:hypothetical protein
MGNSKSSDKSANGDIILIDMLNDEKLVKTHALYDFIFNLLLVKHNARQAYLFETSNFLTENVGDQEHMSYISSFLRLISSIGLFYQLDPISFPDYPRYWVSKEKIKKIPINDEEIGQLLGFKDPGGDYFNFREKRLTLRIKEEITGSGILTEILSPHMISKVQEHAKEKVESFNKVINNINHMYHLDMPYHFIYMIEQDDGTLKRLEELQKMNMKYLNDNKKDYMNDLENVLDLQGEEVLMHPIMDLFKKSLKDKKLFKKYLPLFEYIYELYNEDSGDYKTIINLINRRFIDLLTRDGY